MQMKPGDLRTILKYVPQFQGRIFIVCLDSGVIASSHYSNLLLDLAVLRSLGLQIVVVFGAATQVRMLAAERGVTLSSPDAGANGPTDALSLELCIDAVGRMNSHLMQNFSRVGIRAASANVLTVRAAGIVGGEDQLNSGRVDGVEAESLRALMNENLLPVVAPLGYDAKGNTLYLNSDAVAAEIGITLGASKVLFLTDERDYIFPEGSPRQYSVSEIQETLANSKNGLGAAAVSKLRNAMNACREGVTRVHLIPGFHEEALLAELFSSEGIGTMVYSDTYQEIRKANQQDVDTMVTMTRRATESGQIVARSRDEIQDRLEDFWVVEVDGNLLGCAALHIFWDDRCAEINNLFVRRSHVGRGYGQLLMQHLEKRAKQQGMERVFVFTTQAADFFIDKCGYTEERELAWVPPMRFEKWRDSGRNSRFFWKNLS